MKLTKNCTIALSEKQQIILGCLCYATRKLWNVGNYERKQWTKESGDPYPNWHGQKKRLKGHFWYKSLPSQSAQELLKKLDGSWKSFYKLVETGGIENPKPPKYKQENFNISFLNNSFKVLTNNQIRLCLPKSLKLYLSEKYGIKDNYLIVDVPKHLQLDAQKIKTIEFKPLNNGKYKIVCVVDVDTEAEKQDDAKFIENSPEYPHLL